MPSDISFNIMKKHRRWTVTLLSKENYYFRKQVLMFPVWDSFFLYIYLFVCLFIYLAFFLLLNLFLLSSLLVYTE